MTRRRSPAFYRLIGLIGTNRVVRRLHPVVYQATGGRWLVGHNLGVLNIVVVTVGRRSGKVREVALFAVEDGERLVVIGSNAGRDRDPAWVANLRTHPEVLVRVTRDVRPMRARVAEGDERDRLWAAAIRGYPGFDDYASWTTRRIPVIVLEPVATSTVA